MKRFLIALLLFSDLPARAEHLDVSRIDHQAHAVFSYGISLSTQYALEKAGLEFPSRVILASLLTMAVGVGKELSDKEFSCGDLEADALGAAGAVAFTWTFD